MLLQKLDEEGQADLVVLYQTALFVSLRRYSNFLRRGAYV